MFFVYILKDELNKHYIGYSENVNKRFQEHKNKKVFTTRKMQNPQLYYYEAYPDKTRALAREKSLKQFGSSYTGLMKRIGLK